MSLLNYSDRARPPWPQRRTLLKARSTPLPHLLQTCHSVLHTTPSLPNRRYPFPALTRRQNTRLRALPPTRSFPSTSGRPTSTASNPCNTYPLTPARACSADTTIARIRQILNCAIPTTPNRVLGIAVNPIPRFRSFSTQQLNRQAWQAKLPSSATRTSSRTVPHHTQLSSFVIRRGRCGPQHRSPPREDIKSEPRS